jgi:hypothetical protein
MIDIVTERHGSGLLILGRLGQKRWGSRQHVAT